MPHHEKIALTGVIEHVFAHRFTFIADDAFSGTVEYVLGFPGTAAEAWAIAHHAAFIEIDDAWLASH